jgi:tight adherence protein C
MQSQLYGWLAMAMVGSGIGLGIFTLGSNRPEDSPRLGSRGLKRQRALDEAGSFAQLEPLVRMIAGWVAYFPISDQRRKIDELLKHAGDYLGLTANEFFAMSAVGFIIGSLVTLIGLTVFEGPAILFMVGGALGAATPYFNVTGERD